MKGKQTALALPLLAKRILRLQSSVFTKLYLFSECSDAETDGDSHARPMAAALARIEESLGAQLLRAAFEKVQAAGWKRIPEAQTEEEEDSERSSISECGFSDQSLSILPRSEGLLEESTNTLPSFQPCYSQKATPFSIFGKGRADVTRDSSQSSKNTLRVSKRALILKKLESIEAGVEYLGIRLRLGQ